jgi:hypothetical protein
MGDQGAFAKPAAEFEVGAVFVEVEQFVAVADF